MDVLQIFGGLSVRGCDLNKVEKRCCSPVGLLRVCGNSFLDNTSGGLLLNKDNFICDF